MELKEEDSLTKIKVFIDLDTFLRDRATRLELAGKVKVIEMPEHSRISDVLEFIGLDKKFISFAAANGERQGLEFQLINKDKVAFYPYLVGG